MNHKTWTDHNVGYNLYKYPKTTPKVGGRGGDDVCLMLYKTLLMIH